MKTPDEIKRGLGCTPDTTDGCYSSNCPYNSGYCLPDSNIDVRQDALAYIQQLERDNAQKDKRIQRLERERDAAMNAIESRRSCIDCKHSKVIPDGNWLWTDCPKRDGRCRGKNLWEWRGVEDDKDEA